MKLIIRPFVLVLAFCIALVLLSFEAVQISATSEPQGMINYWKLDGNTKNEISGGYDGTLSGTTTWVEGKFGNALKLSGNGYMQMPSAAIPATSGFTVSGWIRVDDLSSSRHWTGRAENFDFAGDFYGAVITDGKVQFGLRTDPGNARSDLMSTGTHITTETWYHVALVYDGSYMKIYVNGDEVASTSKTGAVPVSDSPYCYIGRSGDGTEQFWNGAIDEVKIFNRGLSPAEVAALYTEVTGAANIIYVVMIIVVAIGCIVGAVAFVKWKRRAPKPPPLKEVPPEPSPAKIEVAPKLSPAQIESMVYGYIVSHAGKFDIDECAEALEIPKSDVEAAIKALKATGRLKKKIILK